MPRKRRGHQGAIDANQPDIVKALRKIPGVQVLVDMDDILIGYRGVNYWIEIKDPEKCLNGDGSWRNGSVKDCQIELDRSWPGQYAIVTSLKQILEIIGISP